MHISLTLVTGVKPRNAAEDLGAAVPSCSLVKVPQPKPPNVWGPCGNCSSPWCPHREKASGGICSEAVRRIRTKPHSLLSED